MAGAGAGAGASSPTKMKMVAPVRLTPEMTAVRCDGSTYGKVVKAAGLDHAYVSPLVGDRFIVNVTFSTGTADGDDSFADAVTTVEQARVVVLRGLASFGMCLSRTLNPEHARKYCNPTSCKAWLPDVTEAVSARLAKKAKYGTTPPTIFAYSIACADGVQVRPWTLEQLAEKYLAICALGHRLRAADSEFLGGDELPAGKRLLGMDLPAFSAEEVARSLALKPEFKPIPAELAVATWCDDQAAGTFAVEVAESTEAAIATAFIDEMRTFRQATDVLKRVTKARTSAGVVSLDPATFTHMRAWEIACEGASITPRTAKTALVTLERHTANTIHFVDPTGDGRRHALVAQAIRNRWGRHGLLQLEVSTSRSYSMKHVHDTNLGAYGGEAAKLAWSRFRRLAGVNDDALPTPDALLADEYMRVIIDREMDYRLTCGPEERKVALDGTDCLDYASGEWLTAPEDDEEARRATPAAAKSTSGAANPRFKAAPRRVKTVARSKAAAGGAGAEVAATTPARAASKSKADASEAFNNADRAKRARREDDE